MVKIEKIVQDNIEKIDIVDLKVIKKLNEDHYIVADESGFVLLLSDQILQENTSYKLIKPKYNQDPQKLIKNPKFSAVKKEVNIKVKKLSIEIENRLKKDVETKPETDEIGNMNDFSQIQMLGINSIANEITVMVTSMSSTITGKFGTYRIITCKDIKNQKNSINLYKHHQDKVETGQSYKITKLKVNNFKKEDQDFNRLGTTHATKIVQASEKHKEEFEKNGVILGDKVVKGTILGVADLKCYESCVQCWCKVDEEGFCRKCFKKITEKKKDFNMVLYVQNIEDEDDILDLFVFKSTLDMKDLEENIDEGLLNKRLVDQICHAEYIENKEDEKKKVVKIKIDG